MTGKCKRKELHLYYSYILMKKEFETCFWQDESNIQMKLRLLCNSYSTHCTV